LSFCCDKIFHMYDPFFYSNPVMLPVGIFLRWR
jgi:hypothetical protein